jgi:hypothetical protein
MLHRRAGGDDALFARLAEGLVTVVVDGGIVARTVRGGWALGQLGKAWLPHAKRRLATATNGTEVLTAALALLAIGGRHEDLRAEVVRAFDPPPTLSTEEARTWATWVSPGSVKLLATIEEVAANHRRGGAALAHAYGELYPESSPYRYARPEDVPADIAFAHPFHLATEFVRGQGTLPNALVMTVLAARAAPEALYLPRRCVEFIEPAWTPEQSLGIMEGWLEVAKKPAPRATGPARKGPCPCGSGKKYKRCCEGAETA